jgi:ribosomal protein S18 acetylase RimI-like enzyme
MNGAEKFCREIEEKEIPELGKLAGEIWREYYPGVIGKDQTEYMLNKFYGTEALKKQMLENGHRFFFWINHDKPSGYASLDFSPEDHVMLSKFYLHASLRGKGIAPIFLSFLEEQIKAADQNTVRLTVNRQNIRAINFYFKAGFKIIQVADFDIGEGYFMNDFIMEKTW